MLSAVSDTILVKVEYAKKMSGLYVPDQAKQYSGEFVGVIESIGPDCPCTELKKGDRIAFCRHEGYTVQNEKGEKFLCLNAKWVLGKIEN
ncbi:MAG: hypothetical protein WC810_03085 [Janthinobacterium sp.]|jgi:co-chaperonin GroES (HSP10)